MIDTEKLLDELYPDAKFAISRKWLIQILKKLLHQDDFNAVIHANPHLRGFAFLDKLLQHVQFSYRVSANSIANIPSEGRLLIVANHPLGTLDGLALLKLIHSVRPDVRIVVNRVLAQMQPLQSVFICVDVLTDKKAQKNAYKQMQAALSNEEAVIIFPAGEVSRITPTGVRDGKWQSGFLKIAKKAQCPILPIYIKATNSAVFYALSMLYKPLGTLRLVEEMFNKQHQELSFQVGAPIPYAAFCDSNDSTKQLCQRFRKHVLNLAKKKPKALFDTITAVTHPVDAKALKKALYQSRLLGETKDHKKIFLYQYRDDCPVMQEIARLREITFRAVEEGTGLSHDLDAFDAYYQHLVLWDEEDLEIVGSYRIGDGQMIMDTYGIEGFYTHSLFDLNADYHQHLRHSIELGRSFVQPRYWGQRSLDYLWYGIGAYLREKPDIKYLFGAVSLSNAYPLEAKELIIGFYRQQFGSSLSFGTAKTPFVLSEQGQQFAASQFIADYDASFKILNSELRKLGVKVPTLYKQYVELCVDHGCHFIDFNIDANFGHCIDSLIMVELDKIAPKKRQRYIETAA